MDLETAGFILGVAVYGVLIVKFLMDRTDTKVKEESDARREEVEAIRTDMESIKDNHVRRDDHNRHVEAVERQIQNVTAMVASMGQNINTRLDNLVSVIAASFKSKE